MPTMAFVRLSCAVPQSQEKIAKCRLSTWNHVQTIFVGFLRGPSIRVTYAHLLVTIVHFDHEARNRFRSFRLCVSQQYVLMRHDDILMTIW